VKIARDENIPVIHRKRDITARVMLLLVGLTRSLREEIIEDLIFEREI